MENFKRINIGNSQIIVDNFSFEKNQEIRDFIKNTKFIEEMLEKINSQIYIILGGDGTMLRAINSTAEDKIPYLGINFGTKGFLLNDKNYLGGDSFVSKKYPLLDINVKTEKLEFFDRAFNEAQIKAGGGTMIDLDLKIGENSNINLRGDGLLIVTPAGSTGYNLSASGPILPHDSNTFIATPLLVFEPKGVRPVVFPNNMDVKIIKNNERKPKMSVYADSKEIIADYEGEAEIIIKKSSQEVELLIAKSYEKSWNNKIYSEQGFNIS
ncbi:MAG: NAD(+)/NADH kinase [Candidatus Gracilibacteria bacterium]|nr:NAD(+)/NADH kinase [Candidatus Gracilibacteria bacterium]